MDIIGKIIRTMFTTATVTAIQTLIVAIMNWWMDIQTRPSALSQVTIVILGMMLVHKCEINTTGTKERIDTSALSVSIAMISIRTTGILAKISIVICHQSSIKIT